MKASEWTRASLVVGVALISAAAIIPSSTLITYLRGPLASIPAELLLGAAAFRACLGLLGLAIVVLRFLPMWQVEIHKNAPFASSSSRTVWVVLGAILVAASALRLYRLDSGLWLDEILTRVLFAQMPFGVIVTTYESENQHFLYSLLAHGSFLLFGDSAWALRLPAALFGVGSIWALYLVGRQVASARESLLAAALLTFSYTHVWFSQNARGYSGLLFFTLLSSWAFLRASTEKRGTLWVIYAVLSALGVYTHVTMLFFVAAHLLIYLPRLAASRGRALVEDWSGFCLGFGLAGLLTLQLYALVLPQVLGGVGREVSVVTEWKNPLWTLLEIAKGLQLSFGGSVAAVGALLVFVAGAWSYLRTRPVVILLLLLPSCIGAALTVALGHHLWPRFFFFEMGFGALVVVRGVTLVADRVSDVFRLSAKKTAWLGSAACLGMILVSAWSVPLAYGPKQDYEGAAAFVEAHKGPGDAVLVAGLATFPYKNLFRKDWQEVDTAADLERVRSSASRTWLVYTFPTVLEAVSPEIMASIERDARVVAQFPGTVGDGVVLVSRFDRPSGGLVSQR